MSSVGHPVGVEAAQLLDRCTCSTTDCLHQGGREGERPDYSTTAAAMNANANASFFGNLRDSKKSVPKQPAGRSVRDGKSSITVFEDKVSAVRVW